MRTATGTGGQDLGKTIHSSKLYIGVVSRLLGKAYIIHP